MRIYELRIGNEDETMRSRVARPVLPLVPVTSCDVVFEGRALAPVEGEHPYQRDEDGCRGDAAEEGVAVGEAGQLLRRYILHAHHKVAVDEE